MILYYTYITKDISGATYFYTYKQFTCKLIKRKLALLQIVSQEDNHMYVKIVLLLIQVGYLIKHQYCIKQKIDPDRKNK